MNRNILEFIETYIKAIKDKNAAIFAGAGLSVNAGYVNWKELMREIAEELGLDVDRENDLIQIAQFYRNSRNGRGNINQKIIDEFTKNVTVNDNHRLLSTLPIETFWTTNYDNIIEKTLEQAGKIVDTKIAPENLSYSKRRRNAVVYKMHGDISLPNNAVLTKDDYECYNEKRQVFTTALQGDLITKTFLFWGFSFDDPNLEYILSRIRILLGENTREHYCFFRQINKNDYHNKEDYIYDCTKQELKIQDLKRYSIQALLVDNYSDITDIIRIIHKRLKEDTLFISVAMAKSDLWKQEDAETFVFKLSKRIVERNIKVVSGFGAGIGSATINGVLSYVHSVPEVRMDDYLILKPFPQNIIDETERKQLWLKYREEMLIDVGIAIFLFGNKIKDEKLIDSDGMIEEFEVAVKNGAVIIPVACTGYASKTIWDIVMQNPEKYYGDNKKLIENIQHLSSMVDDDIDNIINKILEIIELIRDKRRIRLHLKGIN